MQTCQSGCVTADKLPSHYRASITHDIVVCQSTGTLTFSKPRKRRYMTRCYPTPGGTAGNNVTAQVDTLQQIHWTFSCTFVPLPDPQQIFLTISIADHKIKSLNFNLNHEKKMIIIGLMSLNNLHCLRLF